METTGAARPPGNTHLEGALCPAARRLSPTRTQSTPEMRLFCWIRGHHWFATVITHAQIFPPWDRDVSKLGEFEEAICLRCQKTRATYIKTIDTHNPDFGLLGEWSANAPAWVTGGPQHFPKDDHWESP